MTIDRSTHPRPQFIRKDWASLDGKWDFAFDDENKGKRNNWFQGFEPQHKIQVPFTYETEASGIHEENHHQILWYQTTFQAQADQPITLHFEGVDYVTEVWVNGQKIGRNQGAYSRFSFLVDSELCNGDNRLVLRVEDSLATDQPRGKQRWLKDNFGCWYVQTTGIWKSVWLENTPTQYLDRVKVTPAFDQDQMIFEPQVKHRGSYRTGSEEKLSLEIKLLFDGLLVSQSVTALAHDSAPIALDTRVREDACWGTKVWHPHHPDLYDIEYRLLDENRQVIDEVHSYCGMRKIAIEEGQILLNNEKLYQRLILDQGYWPESGITPPSIDAMKTDLARILEMGYNGLRKHQKIEDERFLYLCDQMGLLVWVEMPSTYTFNDTAIQNLTKEWTSIVWQHYNHPSVITWVPFNESWGIKGIHSLVKPQQLTESIYHLTKAIDSQRPVITNDGWEHTVSDILTLHDYEEVGERFSQRYADKEAIVTNQQMFNNDWFAFAHGYHYNGQPVIISEFGGIAFTTDSDEDWGYGNQVKDDAAFMARFDAIHQAIQNLPYVTGYCYTQLTDVEQEVNGLLDPQRAPKVDLAAIKKINQRRIK
ncbi:sugar-binding domain-containing protein [Enterococcus sp.]|uniref:glycoside hydrolase family 2 protein n=1 Tax=Enterococcus sp. TaxID=35783 RepID=UPI00289E656D|nr:sugar-binding domain-containing protein [Enterococcus sp.]